MKVEYSKGVGGEGGRRLSLSRMVISQDYLKLRTDYPNSCMFYLFSASLITLSPGYK